MPSLISLVLANATCALVLAVPAYLVGRWGRRPALAHGLWVLVLLKLMTPPLFPLPVAWLPAEPPAAAEAPVVDGKPAEFFFEFSGVLDVGPQWAIVQQPGAVDPGQQQTFQLLANPVQSPVAPAAVDTGLGSAAAALPEAPAWTPAVLVPWAAGGWAVGTAVWYVAAARRIGRFRRLLRFARPAPPELQEHSDRLAAQMGLRHPPAVRLLPGPLPPLVWAVLGRACVYFPTGLLDRLDADQRASLLAHELAHVRRRDHWVRWLEVAVGGLYWWFPLVWLARHRIQACEEECCDAWVVGELPARSYATALLSALDFLSDTGGLPVLASGLSRVDVLKQRLTLIMTRGTPKRLGTTGRLAVLAAALGLLPLVPTLTRAEAQVQATPAEAAPANPPTPAAADFVEDAFTFFPKPATLSAGPGDVMSAAVSGDGLWLAAGNGDGDKPGEIVVWDFPARKVVYRLHTPLGVSSVVFSPDNRLLAAASWDNQVRVLELPDFRLRSTIGTPAVTGLAFAPDGHSLATAAGTREVRLWDADTGHALARLEADPVLYYSVAFSPDGRRLLAAGHAKEGEYQGRITAWDTATRRPAATVLSHGISVMTVCYSPDGRTLATGGADNAIHILEAGTLRRLRTIEGHSHWVKSLAFSPDGKRLVSTGQDGAVKLWNPATGQLVREVERLNGPAYAAAFSPDGRFLVTGGAGRSLKLWDAESGKEVAVLQPAAEPEPEAAAALGLSFAPDGRSVAVALENKTVQVRDTVTGTVRLVLRGNPEPFTCLAFTPNGKSLVTGSPDRAVCLWDTDSGQKSRTFTGHTNWVYAVAVSPDGRLLASGAYDRTVRLWEAASGRELAVLTGARAAVRAVAFSPDGKLLAAAGGDRAVRVWSVADQKELFALTGHAGGVRSLVFSPDGRTLASAGEDGTVRLWDLATGKERAVLTGHRGAVTCLAFAPRSQVLVSGGQDHAVRVWDPCRGSPLATLNGHGDEVSGVAFAPDGRSLASTSLDQTVRLWHAVRGRKEALPER